MQITFSQGPAQFEAISIDSAGARDLDDAFRVRDLGPGRYRLEVAIANAADAIAIGSAEDADARALGETRYRGGRAVRPLLPRALAEDRLSLSPGGWKPAFLISLTLDVTAPGAVVQAIDLGRTRLRNIARLDHAQATAALHDTAALPPGIVTELKSAYGLAQRLMQLRREQGALAVSLADAGLLVTEEGAVIELTPAMAPAYVLVQELMILTNQALARVLLRLEVPALFRNQALRLAALDPAAFRAGLQGALAAQDGTALRQLCQRLTLNMAPAAYAATAYGHAGLNVPGYGHFTSPLRRYADLVNTRLLAHLIDGRPLPYDRAALDQLADELNRPAARRRRKTARAAPAPHAEAHALHERLLAAAGAGGYDADLKQTLLLRLGFGELPLRTLAALAFAPGLPADAELGQAITALLVQTPALAPSILAHAAAQFGVPAATVRLAARSRRSLHFQALAVFDHAGRRCQHQTPWLLGRRRARHAGLAGVLAAWLGVTLAYH